MKLAPRPPALRPFFCDLVYGIFRTRSGPTAPLARFYPSAVLDGAHSQHAAAELQRRDRRRLLEQVTQVLRARNADW
jgi:hypothetical protein